MALRDGETWSTRQGHRPQQHEIQHQHYQHGQEMLHSQHQRQQHKDHNVFDDSGASETASSSGADSDELRTELWSLLQQLPDHLLAPSDTEEGGDDGFGPRHGGSSGGQGGDGVGADALASVRHAGLHVAASTPNGVDSHNRETHYQDHQDHAPKTPLPDGQRWHHQQHFQHHYSTGDSGLGHMTPSSEMDSRSPPSPAPMQPSPTTSTGLNTAANASSAATNAYGVDAALPQDASAFDQQDMARLQTLHRAQVRRVQQLEHVVRELQDAHQSDMDAARQHLATRDDCIHTLEQQLDAASQKAQHATTAADSHHQLLEQEKTKVRVLEHRVGQLKLEAETATATANAAEAELRDLRRTSLEAHGLRLNGHLTKVASEHAQEVYGLRAELQQALRHADQQQKQAAEEIALLQQRVNELTEESQHANETHESVEAGLRVQLLSAQRRCQELATAPAAAPPHFNNLEQHTSVLRCDVAVETLDDLEPTHEQPTAIAQAATQDTASQHQDTASQRDADGLSASSLALLQHARQECDDLRALANQLSELNHTTQAELEAMRARATQAEAACEQVPQLAQQLVQAHADKQKLLAAARRASLNLRDRSVQEVRLQAEDRLAAITHDFESQIADLKAQLEAAQKQFISACEQKRTVERQLSEQNTRVAEYEDRLALMQTQLELQFVPIDQVEAAKAQVTDARHQVDELRAELRLSEAKVQTLLQQQSKTGRDADGELPEGQQNATVAERTQDDQEDQGGQQGDQDELRQHLQQEFAAKHRASLKALRDHYLNAAKGIQEDVKQFVAESQQRTKATVQHECLRERDRVAARLHGYYLRVIELLIDQAESETEAQADAL